MEQISKRNRKLLREAAEEAYRRELSAELEKLREEFERWRQGEISPFELTERIHKYHQGPARELYVHYTGNWTTMMVAGAVSKGVMKLEELPPEVAELVRPMLEGLKRIEQE